MYDYTNPYASQPTYSSQAEVAASADSAFSKGLAAAIMSLFPVTCIIAIFMGIAGNNLVASTRDMAARYGISAGGKCNAAKILSMFGMINGIVNTAGYIFIFVIYFFYMMMIFMAMSGGMY